MELKQNKSRILLTEDEPIASKVHRMYLEKMGYMVDVAINGTQTLEIYKKNHWFYQVIILDVGLPDINGFEVARCIRQYENKNQLVRIPLLILSGYPHEQLEPECALADVDNFANKPIAYAELQKLLSTVLLE